jgi:tryptophan synthase alpha chain
MSRLSGLFDGLRRSGRKALIPYITSGHPQPDSTVAIMHAMVAHGADCIELGVPFSDPMADGPVIQRANEQALRHRIGLKHVLDYVAQFRQHDQATPIVLMGYANPVERMGTAKFLDRAKSVGVDGVIVVDYPPEEAGEFAAAATSVGVDPVFLLAPTSTEQRITDVLALARGYVYYVSLRGITGGVMDMADVERKVSHLRSRTTLPIGVGFGIRDGLTARAVAQIADAVIIGTRMIQVIEDGAVASAPQRAGQFIATIRAALDGKS